MMTKDYPSVLKGIFALLNEILVAIATATTAPVPVYVSVYKGHRYRRK